MGQTNLMLSTIVKLRCARWLEKSHGLICISSLTDSGQSQPKKTHLHFMFVLLFITPSTHHTYTPLPSLPTLSALSPHLQTSTVVALLVAVVVVRLVGLVLLFNQQQQHANNLCTRPLLSWIICLA